MSRGRADGDRRRPSPSRRAAARDLFDRAAAWFADHADPHERFARRRAEVERLLAEAEPR